MRGVARSSSRGDTGPLHLADALGAPTLALFGPTDPARNGPYRDRRGVITGDARVADEDVLRRALAVAGLARNPNARPLTLSA